MEQPPDSPSLNQGLNRSCHKEGVMLPTNRMRSFVVIFFLAAACSSGAGGRYVPGGQDLDEKTRMQYRDAVQRERRGDPVGALKILDEICAAQPSLLGLHLHRLRLSRQIYGAETAAELYAPPPAGFDSERAGILVELARLPSDDPARRKALLEYAVAREPDEPFWHLGLADVGLTAHRLLMERSNRDRSLGRLQAETQSREEAVAALDRARKEAQEAARLDPLLSESELLLGFIQTRAADLEGDPNARDKIRATAQTHYERALALDPDSLEGRINLAETHLYFDRFEKAAAELRKATEIAPRDPKLWNNLGYTYYSVGQLTDAVTCYRRVLEFGGPDARARIALSDCERRLGNTKQATTELETARNEADAEDRELRAVIAFKLAAIYEFDEEYRKAVAEYERHIELGGKHADKARSRVRFIYEHAFE
jgi:tetratricopeptide (TPR) repeat protein